MEKRSYTVAASTGPLDTFGPEIVDQFAEALAQSRYLSGTVASGDSLTRRLSMRGSVDAPHVQRAMTDGISDVYKAFRAVGVPPRVVDFRVLEDLAEDEFASARDDVVGTPEVADRLGISRQRVAQLVEQKGRFPQPVAAVRGTHVWQWGDIADWIAAGARDMRRRQPDNTVDLIDALKRKVARESQPRGAAAKRLARR